MSDLQFVPTPTGKPCRVLIDGGEPVAVVYDLPTGRNPAMTHQVLHNNPKVMAHVYKTMVDKHLGYVIDRAGLRAMAAVYGEIEPHFEATRRANVEFINWIHGAMVPFLDDMDARLRLEKAGILPLKEIKGLVRLDVGGAKFQMAFGDPDIDTIHMEINGAKWTMTLRQFIMTLGGPVPTEGILAALQA